MPRSSARLNAKASGSGSNAAAASSSTQPLNDSLANPELDKLLNLKRHKLKDHETNHTPRFPAFHELQPTDMLLSEDEVKAYRNSLRGPPDKQEAKLFLVNGGRNPKFSWYEDIYNSITETRYARDPDGRRPRTKRWNDEYYGRLLLVAITSLLALKLTKCVKDGVMQSNDEGQEPSLENISIVQRHRDLCLVLLFEKDIVEEVLRGDDQTITNLVAGPASYALRKEEVRNSWVAGILAASRAAGSSPEPNLPMPPRNKSIPAYPNFGNAVCAIPNLYPVTQWGEKYFADLRERFPLKPEKRLGWLKESKPQLVIALYDAIRSVSDIRSHEDGINGAHFIAHDEPLVSPRTSAKTIQDACWRIATAFLDGVEHGFVKPKMPNPRDPRKLPPGSENLPWDRRFKLMLAMLRRRKALCWRLVKSSRGLDCFIAEPFLFRNLGICDADPKVAAFHPEDVAMFKYNSILFEEGIAQ